MPVLNNGSFAGIVWENNSLISEGLQYKGIHFIFSSGLWIAAEVEDSVRAAISMFDMTDFTRGVIDAQGEHYGADDSVKFRVYKINRGDTPATNPDYADWPVDFGAPTDERGNPLIMGYQTLWSTYTDAYQPNRWFNPSLPLKAELHLLVWGWQDIDNAVFLHWDIINKSGEDWQNAYLGVFVDPDVADPEDDLVASDSLINMVYCYESELGELSKSFQTVGYILLETPMVQSPGDTAYSWRGEKSNYRNAGASSPLIYKYYPQEWNENAFNRGEFTKNKVYDRLRGRDNHGNPMINPLTGEVTKWGLSGDAVLQMGWLDDLPQDRRMMISTGPFDLAAGDTCGLTLAIVADVADNRWQSIVQTKQRAALLHRLFKYRFKVIPDVEVNADSTSLADSARIYVRSSLSSENPLSSVKVNFYNQQSVLVYEMPLFDDGNHFDAGAGDGIFGNMWQTSMDGQIYHIDLTVVDDSDKNYYFDHVAENIILGNRLVVQGDIVDDNINFDGKANPGENVRVSLTVQNNYEFDIERLNFIPVSKDSLIQLRQSCLILDDALKSGESRNITYDPVNKLGYFEFNVPESIKVGYRFLFELDGYDNEYHHWKNYIEIPVDTLNYFPEEIKPEHVNGRGDADFTIKIIDPSALLKHTYEISVVDSINEKGDKGFNLQDLTAGKTLLENNPPPDKYGYNVPIIDGFKITWAYLPEGGPKDDYFVEIPGGHETGFHYKKDYNSTLLGEAPYVEYQRLVKVEFTNEINSSGVIGAPAGQKAFRYEHASVSTPTGFFTCPFNVWKVENGQRTGLMNVGFEEWPMFFSYDDEWGPNAQSVGGFETIYIMKTDYDESGQYYQNKPLDMKEVLYEITFVLNADSSVVDPGDKFVFEFEIPASSQDKFGFVPTDVEDFNSRAMPQTIELFQNYPNPFNSSTVVKFQLNKKAIVKLTIFNILGQKVTDVIDKEMSPGIYHLTWDGKGHSGQLVPSGLYFVRLDAAQQSKTIKILLIR
ncbi:MAG: T9SS type A sorting domain-containing protein [Calditrichaeota bacterium]|nr:T9SS type A sorting domain-containing protein [Calditrichota bacterium]